MATSLTYIHPFTLNWVLQIVFISGINALFKVLSQIIRMNVCLISGVLSAQIHHITLCALGHGDKVGGQAAPHVKSVFILRYRR